MFDHFLSCTLSAETGLMHVETHGDVPRPLEVRRHGEILLENGKIAFSAIGGDPVL